MKKMFAVGLALICLLSLVGCSEQKQAKELPVPEYPLNKEFVVKATEIGGLPNNLAIEENDLLE